jgi:hypothetical protein
MRFLEKAVNALAQAISWILRLEPSSPGVMRSELHRQELLDATLHFKTLRIIVRKDAKERVRITQVGEDFGAVLDFDDAKSGWSPSRILGAGFVFESLNAALTEAERILPWMRQETAVPKAESQLER